MGQSLHFGGNAIAWDVLVFQLPLIWRLLGIWLVWRVVKLWLKKRAQFNKDMKATLKGGKRCKRL